MLPSTRGVTVMFTGYGAAEHGRGDEERVGVRGTGKAATLSERSALDVEFSQSAAEPHIREGVRRHLRVHS